MTDKKIEEMIEAGIPTTCWCNHEEDHLDSDESVGTNNRPCGIVGCLCNDYMLWGNPSGKADG